MEAGVFSVTLSLPEPASECEIGKYVKLLSGSEPFKDLSSGRPFVLTPGKYAFLFVIGIRVSLAVTGDFVECLDIGDGNTNVEFEDLSVCLGSDLTSVTEKRSSGRPMSEGRV